jgi:hypothetical protein
VVEARDHRERHDRRDESLVGVGDRELHANDAAPERGQERIGVRVADVEADHLAAPDLERANDQRVAYNLRAVADLVDPRVEPADTGSGPPPVQTPFRPRRLVIAPVVQLGSPLLV